MKDQPVRKHPRLKEYDYSTPGYYYVTIYGAQGICFSGVGRGLAPAVAVIRLTQMGTIAQQLLALEDRYKTVKIDRYVIMPNHIPCDHLLV